MSRITETTPAHVLAAQAFRARFEAHIETHQGRYEPWPAAEAYVPAEPPAHVLAAQAFRARLAALVAGGAR
jgi:hypothetical protein